MTEAGNHKKDESVQLEVENSVDSAPAELESAYRKLAEKRPELTEFMAMAMGPMGNPLHRKMTGEHISQVLTLAEKRDERLYELSKQSQDNDFSEGKSNRAYCFTAFIVIILLTVIVLFLFQNKPEVLVPILTGLGGLVSGFLGGWGLGSKQK